MIGKRPDPDDEYQDWEYPDPKDIEQLANLPLNEERSSFREFALPILIKIVGAVMILALIGSLFAPFLGSRSDSGDSSRPSSGNTAQEAQAYQQWIWSSVSAALKESGAPGQAQFLGIQFGDSIQDPIIGILAEGLDPHSSSGRNALQNHSIAVLQRLFADERAQSVNLAWLESATDSGSGQPLRRVILMIGMLRQTAQSINWPYLMGEDLQKVADYYEEPMAAPQESLQSIRMLDRL